MKRYLVIYGIVSISILMGCTEKNPTSSIDNLVGDLNPRTLEVILPFESFASDIRVIGGYGTPATMGRGIIAKEFQGLNSKTLIRFGGYPDSVRIFDSTSGIESYDKEFSLIGGRLVLYFDTIQGAGIGPADISVSALQQDWDVRTANWKMAIDTAGDRTDWAQPGGGVTVPIGVGTFDRQFGRGDENDTIPFNDSLSIAVDSARIAQWADMSDDSRGVLVSLENENRRMVIEAARLRLKLRLSILPDSLIEQTAFIGESSFIYDPMPGPPPVDDLRIGGAPSWRTIISLDIPSVLNGPPEVCEVLVCPFYIGRSDAQVNLAELLLTPRETDPAYQLFDSLSVDLRAVINPELLPKSPLSGQLTGAFGTTLKPDFFSGESDKQIAFPITNVVRDLMLGDSATLANAHNTIALLVRPEPPALGFASFYGPGNTKAPVLRLLLTVAGKLVPR